MFGNCNEGSFNKYMKLVSVSILAAYVCRQAGSQIRPIMMNIGCVRCKYFKDVFIVAYSTLLITVDLFFVHLPSSEMNNNQITTLTRIQQNRN